MTGLIIAFDVFFLFFHLINFVWEQIFGNKIVKKSLAPAKLGEFDVFSEVDVDGVVVIQY